MTDDVVTWLGEEVRDLLDVWSVGLYEFIWLLRSGQPQVPADDRQRIAEMALELLLQGGEVALISLTWPSYDPQGEMDIASLSDHDWEDIPPSGRYAAVIRRDLWAPCSG